MNGFHTRWCGMSNQDSVKTTRKKAANSMVGKITGSLSGFKGVRAGGSLNDYGERLRRTRLATGPSARSVVATVEG